MLPILILRRNWESPISVGCIRFRTPIYLNEGAAAARNIGARCIKVGLSLDTDNPSPKLYPFHSTWPSTETLKDLADTPYFRSLFSRRFDTFILNNRWPTYRGISVRPAHSIAMAFMSESLDSLNQRQHQQLLLSEPPSY